MAEPPHSVRPSPGPSYLDWSTRGRPAIWRYLLALALGYLSLVVAGLVLLAVEGRLTDGDYETVSLLFSFLGMWAGVLLATRAVLRRPAYSVGAPSWPPWVRDWLVGVLIALVIAVIVRLVLLPFVGINWVGWAGAATGGVIAAVLVLVGLIVQTGAEELFFRGLLTQTVFRLSRRLSAGLAIGLAVVVPSLVFAALHVGNIEEFGGGWRAGLPYFLLAVLFAWAAIRSGSVMLAAGLHMGNNAFLVFLVANPSDVLRSFAPFVLADGTDLGPTLAAAVIGAGLGLVAIEAAARKGVVGPRPVAEAEAGDPPAG